MNRPLQTLMTLGVLGAATPALAEKAPCEGTDISSLQSAWDTEGKHYEAGEGEICIDGLQHDWRVSVYEVTEKENFPTNERIVVEVARDLDEETDFSSLHTMGWGETTAMLEGDYLVEAMGVMHDDGWKNPAYLGFNTAGRGTEAYIQSNKISRISLRDEWDDAKELIRVLAEAGRIARETAFNGHSLGAMIALSGAFQLADMDGYNVRSIAYWMPASDQLLQACRPKLINVLSQEIPSAVKSLVTGEGMSLDEASYDKTMFGNGDDFSENFLRAVPDSASRFFGGTFNIGPKIHGELKKESLANTRHFVIYGEDDPIIPDSMPRNWAKLLDRYDLDVQSMTAWSLAHVPPVEASDHQKTVMRTIIDRIVPAAE